MMTPPPALPRGGRTKEILPYILTSQGEGEPRDITLHPDFPKGGGNKEVLTSTLLKKVPNEF